jgi:hypothetical protein
MILEMPVTDRAEPSISSREAGRDIDFSEMQSEKASTSIRVTFEFDSNDKDESDVQLEKQLFPRIETEPGTQIDFSAEQSANDCAGI